MSDGVILGVGMAIASALTFACLKPCDIGIHLIEVAGELRRIADKLEEKP